MNAQAPVSDERLRELIAMHKERAIYFEQASDNGRLVETLKSADPHWEAHDLYRELLDARGRLAEQGWQPVTALLPERDIDIIVEQRIKHGEIVTRAKLWREVPAAPYAPGEKT